MKKIISIIICIGIMLSIVPMAVGAMEETHSSGFAGGNGSPENPFVIKNATQLHLVRDYLNSSFVLGANIDLLSVSNWVPIGSAAQPFTGTFDGNGYVISNINIDAHHTVETLSTTAGNIGFFGYAKGAIIKNLGIENAWYGITSDNFESEQFSNVGGIVGTIENTTLECSYFKGSINNSVGENIFARAAGIAAIGLNSTVTNCYSNSSIYANAHNMNTMAAGLVAWLDSVTVSKCYVAGSVVGENDTGYCYVGGANSSGNANAMFGYIISYGGTVSDSVIMLTTLSANGVENCQDSVGNYSDQINNKVMSSSESGAYQQSIYENLGWDFTTIWQINNSFPELKIFFSDKSVEVFPTGYDFSKDSYNFANYGEGISKKYFTTIYEDGPGTLLYKEKKNVSNNGLCFGMAYTTAAILNGMPDCSIISTLDDEIFEYKYCDSIKEIVNYNLGVPFSDICSAFAINDKVITVEDYIKYAFIYQWSTDVFQTLQMKHGEIYKDYIIL